jgi:hypothetical protein
MVSKSSCPRKNTSPSSEELLVEKELFLSVRILANQVGIARVVAVTGRRVVAERPGGYSFDS